MRDALDTTTSEQNCYIRCAEWSRFIGCMVEFPDEYTWDVQWRKILVETEVMYQTKREMQVGDDITGHRCLKRQTNGGCCRASEEVDKGSYLLETYVVVGHHAKSRCRLKQKRSWTGQIFRFWIDKQVRRGVPKVLYSLNTYLRQHFEMIIL